MGLQSELSAAIARRDCKAVRNILENGADPNILNDDGVAPILQAASLCSCPIVFTLLAHGADPFVKDFFGNDARALLHDNLQSLARELRCFEEIIGIEC